MITSSIFVFIKKIYFNVNKSDTDFAMYQFFAIFAVDRQVPNLYPPVLLLILSNANYSLKPFTVISADLFTLSESAKTSNRKKYTFTVIKKHLLGHLYVLQFWAPVSFDGPTQFLPPCCGNGLVQLLARVLCLFPPLQLRLHVLHSDHEL